MTKRRVVNFTYIGAKVFFHTDAALIQWWKSLSDGERSKVLRAALREYQQKGADAEKGEQEMARQMVRLVDEVAALRQMISSGVVVQREAEQPGREMLSPAEMEERKRKLGERKW